MNPYESPQSCDSVSWPKVNWKSVVEMFIGWPLAVTILVMGWPLIAVFGLANWLSEGPLFWDDGLANTGCGCLTILVGLPFTGMWLVFVRVCFYWCDPMVSGVRWFGKDFIW